MRKSIIAAVILFLLTSKAFSAGPLAKVYIYPGSVSLRPGATQQFKAVGLDADGNEAPVTYPYKWQVSDSMLGTITPDGLFTAGAYSTKAARGVHISVGTVTAFAEVEVKPGKVENSYSFDRAWGMPGPGQLRNPGGMAVDKSGFIYIADTFNHRIQKFDLNGRFINQWGSYGSGPGKLKYPRDVAVSPSGQVFVADTENHRIQKFSSEGAHYGGFGGYGSEPGRFSYPCGVTLDEAGNVFVADTNNHRIQKLNSSGSVMGVWGTRGVGDGQFDTPYSIGIDGAGYIYVMDLGNYRIQKFDINGNFMLKWGSEGTGPDQFSNPNGIGVTANGYVLAADGCRILHFDSIGKLINSWGSFGTGDGQFWSISDALEGYGGRIYALDSQAGCVQMFTWNGDFLSRWCSVVSPKGELAYPQGVALDYEGNVYAVDTAGGCIQKFDRFGTYITRFGAAGSGPAELVWPTAAAVDTKGNIYVVDEDRIVKFGPDGDFLTEWGSSGSHDGQFCDPRGVAVDGNGYVYVVDAGNRRVQKFSPAGLFVTKWGTPGTSQGQFIEPTAIAVDQYAEVYVLDSGLSRFQKFDCSGTYITECTLTSASYNQLCGISVDTNGIVYIVDRTNTSIRLIARNASGGYYQSGQVGYPAYPNSSLIMIDPRSLAVNSSGSIYVADTGANCIMKIVPQFYPMAIYPYYFHGLLMGSRQDFGWFTNPMTGCIFPVEDSITWTTDSALGSVTPDGAFTAGGSVGQTSVRANSYYFSTTLPIQILPPVHEGGYILEKAWSGQAVESLATDEEGSLYMLSKGPLYAVWKFSRHGKPVAFWGHLYSRQFETAAELAVDGEGNIYILDGANCNIRKFDRYFNLLLTWGTRGTADGQFQNPQGIAVDSNGYVYVADTLNRRIQKFDKYGTFITKWDGCPDAKFIKPISAAVDSEGSVYVLDFLNCSVQKFDSDGNCLGKWGITGSLDGQFWNPMTIAVDKYGYVYVADTGNRRIQKYDSNGNFITKFGPTAGGGTLFNNPSSLAVDPFGGLYVAESQMTKVQKFVQGYSQAGAVKHLPDGIPVTLVNQAVSAGSDSLGDCFYAELPDRSSGIKVTGQNAALGEQVLIKGTTTTINGERAIQADSVIKTGNAHVEPLGLQCSQLGGGKYGLQEGVWGWRFVASVDGSPVKQWTGLCGMNNIGLLVRVWGKVKSVDAAAGSFFIDDGFGNNIRCSIRTAESLPSVDSFVTVTGISSCEENQEGYLLPMLRIRDLSDIQVVDQQITGG